MPLPSLAAPASINSSQSSSSSAVLQHIQSHRDVPVEQLFTKLDIVGKGAYGAVYKGIHNATQTVLALKVINLDTAEDDIIEIQREVALLSQMRDSDKHNCIGYHGCYFYQTELWIAMDFASGGSIRTLLKPGKLDEKYAQLIVRETLIGLSYLHRQEIIHRDIKSANILLTNSNRVLLCDFGIAAPLRSTNHKRSTFIGTPYWMAPEVITDGKLYDTKADIWSLGITLYEMLNGNPPFSDLTPAKVILKIPRSQPAKLEGPQFSNSVKEFMAACLIDEPNDRPTAEELFKHKWIKSISKAPLSPLKDLTIRYSKWINLGGVRQSLADISSSSDQNTTSSQSATSDKADWDFMDDQGLDSQNLNGLSSLDQKEYDSKDYSATVRPNPTSNHIQSRSLRPLRLMKLFEEDPNENPMPNKFNFQNTYSPLSPVNHVQGTSSQCSPITGLGFPVPGMSHSELRMEIPPPIISIPSTEEMENFLEVPHVSDPSNPNRPFSPSSFYNRSITPTPSRLKPLNLGTLNQSVQMSNNWNKLIDDGSNINPPLPSPPLSNTNSNHATTPTSNHFMGLSSITVSSSPSLPTVAIKDLELSSSASTRIRANTAPHTQDRHTTAMRSPALPSPMINKGNFAGNGGKQFSGNGFSFGGPSASSSYSNSTTPTGSNLNEPYSAYSSTSMHNQVNSNASTPTSYSHTINPDRDCNPKAAASNPNGYLPQTGNHATNMTTVPSNTRTRPTIDSASQSMSNNRPTISKTSSHTTIIQSRPTTSSTVANNSNNNNPVQLISNWPTGEQIKTSKGLDYHQLSNIKEVKNELEANLYDLSRWLETCDLGLGLLIDYMK